MGNNIGHPVQGEFDPELKEAILKIQKAAKDAGKNSGIYCPNGEVARKYAEAGFQMVSALEKQIDKWLTLNKISVINDMTVIPVGMAQALSVAKGATQQAKGAAYGGST